MKLYGTYDICVIPKGISDLDRFKNFIKPVLESLKRTMLEQEKIRYDYKTLKYVIKKVDPSYLWPLDELPDRDYCTVGFKVEGEELS